MSPRPIHSLDIGHIHPANPFVLAPLDGYSDLPMRLMCRRAGAGLCFTEMVPAMALVCGSRDARRRTMHSCDDHPLVVQIVGHSPDLLARAARIAEDAGADAIDINAGCPSRRVTNGGAGAALLSDLPRLAKILTAVRAAVSRVPVTLKVRSGPTTSQPVLDELARIAIDTGVAAVTLHARARSQGFFGQADWPSIARFKQLFGGVVIGNGDVTSANDAMRMLRETGCDGVMVGRAAIGNPWLFTAMDAMWRGLPPPLRPMGDALREAVLAHFDLLCEYLGDEERGAVVFRKHLCRYVRGLPGAIKLRRRLPSVTNWRTLQHALDEVLPPSAGNQPYEVPI